MTQPAEEQLLGYLVGALDQDEQEEIESRLAGDARLRRQLARMRAEMEILDRACRPAGVQPPPGLAERTCQYVFARAEPAMAGRRREAMSAPASRPGWAGRIRWGDAGVAAAVLVVASVLLVPAIQSSRFRSRIVACQENLRQWGLGLTQYAERNSGFFPQVPREGRLALAGMYAPQLADSGLLPEAGHLRCPGSPQASDVTESKILGYGELVSAPAGTVDRLPAALEGIYGYCPGYLENGVMRRPRNLYRDNFAVMSDPPSPDLPGLQSANHGGYGQNVWLENGGVVFLSTPNPPNLHDDVFKNADGYHALARRYDDSVIFAPASQPIVYASSIR